MLACHDKSRDAGSKRGIPFCLQKRSKYISSNIFIIEFFRVEVLLTRMIFRNEAPCRRKTIN